MQAIDSQHEVYHEIKGLQESKKAFRVAEGSLPKLNYSYYYYLQKNHVDVILKNRVPDTLTGTLVSHKFIRT